MDDPEFRRFREYRDWAQEERSISDPFEKRAIEFAKGSIEFSKLLVTNLHLINAGGLLAITPIANFLEFNKAAPSDKFYLIGMPAGFFTIGLLMAAACALATYFNYQALAHLEWAEQEKAVMDAEVFFPYLQTKDRSEARSRRLPWIQGQIDSLKSKVKWTYRAGHVLGAISALAFASGCVFLALHIR